MAGPWLKFRGHLDNISNNMLIGAVNFYNEKTDNVKPAMGEYGTVPPHNVPIAAGAGSTWWAMKTMEKAVHGTCVMEPRFPCCAILVKSFARIHETNLKNKVCWFHFADKSDYEKIQKMILSRLKD